MISRVRGTVVEWNTPMNLPVVQPYYREVRFRVGCQLFSVYSTDLSVYL